MKSAIDLKFEYTEDNHFKWGFGDEWHNAPDRFKQYKLQLGHIKRPVLSFREECVNAAKHLADRATKPILVGLSGGGDSQMVCLSLREAGVPFKVLITKLYDEFWNLVNEEDISTAYKFCEVYGVEHLEYSINLDYFYNDGALDYAKKYGFTNLHTITQCDMMDYVCNEYCYIMAGGDVVMTPYPNVITPDRILPKIQNTVVPDTITVPTWWQTPQPIMQHMMEMGYEGTSKFFLYTPELLYAYLEHPVTKMFRGSQDIIYQNFTRWHPKPKFGWWKCFQMLYKPLMVKQEFPDVIPARKLTGYESISSTRAPQGERTPYANYKKMMIAASKASCSGQVICPTIDELVEYISKPQTAPMESTRVIHAV